MQKLDVKIPTAKMSFEIFKTFDIFQWENV